MSIKNKENKIGVAILCGGPSLERGISMNSARSVLDHLGSLGVDIVPIYFNKKKKPFKISTAQLYSNTPNDFDFKLNESGKELSESALVRILKSVTIVFPCMHGSFGEDGEIQSFLEKYDIPFIGSSSKSCKMAFDKHKANEYIRSLGFYAPNSIVVKITDTKKEILEKVSKFWKDEKITRAIVKPASGGSSIGVFSVDNIDDAVAKIEHLFSKRMDTRVVVESFAKGKEFTLIILQNRFNMPVALIPSEIEMDYDKHQFFDFRKKYLPTRQVTYHCPPRFSNEVIEKIQIEAEQLFSVFSMRDFARFDGFVMPDGNIWFSDFNPISGMEQNSFLFQQASRIGFSHQDLFRFVINNTCLRRDIPALVENIFITKKRKPVAVLFGGETAEKQVSLMSGTNVWLKLRGSKIYKPYPYLLGKNNEVWELPYSYILNHTVEEIIQNAERAPKDIKRLFSLIEKVKIKLFLNKTDATEKFFMPKKYSIGQILKKHKFVFLALHGGFGENGTIQRILENKKIKYNGSESATSKLCMDKWETNELIEKSNIFGVSVAKHVLLSAGGLDKIIIDDQSILSYWNMLLEKLETKTFIAKPRGDGCTAGVVRIFNQEDLFTYISLIKNKINTAKPHTFTNQLNTIDMPEGEVADIIFESFIETDKLKAHGSKITHTSKSGYMEMTVGVVEEEFARRGGGKIHALSPSITVAEMTILSVEEKFQGGTGVNITPPPKEIISDKNIEKVKNLAETIAKRVGIRGYARMDIFVHIKTGNIILIEINTLPGLTPSTVIYHQALAEKKRMFPTEFLELLIKNKGY